MKKKLSTLLITGALILSLSTPANSQFAVFCANCSTWFTQMLEKAESALQLTELRIQTVEAIKTTTEAITHTANQIKMLQNMYQNIKSLPDQVTAMVKGYFSNLARLTAQLKTQRGDLTALAEVFNGLYPNQSEFANLTNAVPEEIEAANQLYRNHYDQWSKSVDESAQATFQVSGQQLQELVDNGELEDHIDGLLSDPDGHMEALQSANNLAVIQIQEMQKFRALMATATQSAVASQMKAEKEDQMEMELWRAATKIEDWDLSAYHEALP